MEKLPFYKNDLFKYEGEGQIMSYHFTDDYNYVFSISNNQIDVRYDNQQERFDSLIVDYNMRMSTASSNWEDSSKDLFDLLIEENIREEVSDLNWDSFRLQL